MSPLGSAPARPGHGPLDNYDILRLGRFPKELTFTRPRRWLQLGPMVSFPWAYPERWWALGDV